MKPTSTLTGTVLKWLSRSMLFLATLIVSGSIFAQTPVTGITTLTTTNATTGTTYSATGGIAVPSSGDLTGTTYTYNWGTKTTTANNYQRLDAFTTALATFTFQSTTPVVKFRRVNNPNATGLRKLLWFEETGTISTSGTTGGTAAFLPDYDDSLERLFARRIFNGGIDNVFENGSTTNDNNIERVDVIFPGGVKATDGTKVGFAVFDRGNGGSHDPFQIAAIQSLDGSGNPQAYYGAVGAAATNYGNIGSSTALNYHMLRKDEGDTWLRVVIANQTQNRDGVFFTFSALGVPGNAIIYGYSIFATDVVSSPPANIVSYNNPSYFPTTTELGGSGGIDMVAVTGVAATNATYIVLAEKIENFNAVLTNGKVQLNWQLGATDQGKTTVIERSGNGIDFSPLLPFSPSLAGPQTDFDEQPLPGENYYRLKLAGYDGSGVAYSSVCRIDVATADLVSLTAYPNPVKNKQFILNAQGLKNEGYTLRLFDMNGKIILQQKFSGAPQLKKEIVLSGGLPAGTYTIQLANKDGKKVFAGAVVIQ